MKRILSLVLVSVFLLCSVSYAGDKTAVSNTQNSSGYSTLNLTIPINCYDPSEIPVPSDLDIKSIEGISIVKGSTYIPATIDINNDVITITPADYFEYNQSYTMKIFTKTKHYVIPLKALNFQVIDIDDGTVLKIPPSSEKGFNYPYYIYLPDQIEKQNPKRKG